MPYKTNKDLPDNITRALPPHAQDIFGKHLIMPGKNMRVRKNAVETFLRKKPHTK